MKILVASSNSHKLKEIAAVFESCSPSANNESLSIDFVGLTDVDPDNTILEPVEDQDTFEGNAVLKAKHYALATGLWCIADDSGLEVDALNGDPGVLSARFSGATGPRNEVDVANNGLLLERLSETPIEQRTARFVCCMALVSPSDDQIELFKQEDSTEADAPSPRVIARVRGTVEGRILLPEETIDPHNPERGRGSNGFGYDPIFLIDGFEQTAAEMTPQQKNGISHRGDASRKMWQKLAEQSVLNS